MSLLEALLLLSIALCGAQSEPRANTSSCEMSRFSSKLSYSCAQGNSSVKRSTLVWFVAECVSPNAPLRRPLQLRARQSTLPGDLLDIMSTRAKQFTAGTSITIRWEEAPALPTAAGVLPAEVLSISDDLPEGRYDILATSAAELGAAAESGSLLDLGQLAGWDTLLQWEDLFSSLRMAAMYDGKVLALPLNPYPLMLLYRRDLLDAAGIRVPASWEDLLAAAGQVHGRDLDGDGVYEAGVCARWYRGCPGAVAPFAHALLAPYLQSDGLIRGTFFQASTTTTAATGEPPTLEPLLESAAAVEGLQLLLQLRRVGLDPTEAEERELSSASVQPGGNMTVALCADPVTRPFLEGRCVFSLSTFQDFKAASHASSPSNPLRGHLGAAPLPGSTRVLLRSGELRGAEQDSWRRLLVNCSRAMCPLADGQRGDTAVDKYGIVRPVNRAPYIPLSLMAVSTQSSDLDLASLLSYYFAADVASPSSALQALLNPGTVLSPIRGSHTDLGLWTGAGYDRSDAAAVLAAYRTTLETSNPAFELRIVGQERYSAIFNSLLDALLQLPSADAPSLQAALAYANTRLRSAFNATAQPEVVQQYFKSVSNGTTPSEWPPPPVPSTANGTGGGNSTSKHALKDWSVILMSLAAIALLVAVGLLMWRYGRTCSFRSYKPRSAPSPGPDTTLMLTDISDSTTLWEVLPADVMDHSVRLHSMTVRHLLIRHHGYESATEGDAFIAAFDNPLAALNFACDLQILLLRLEWPKELLATPEAAPMYAVPAVSLATSNRQRLRSDASVATITNSHSSPSGRPQYGLMFGNRPVSSTDLNASGELDAPNASFDTACTSIHAMASGTDGGGAVSSTTSAGNTLGGAHSELQVPKILCLPLSASLTEATNSTTAIPAEANVSSSRMPSSRASELLLRTPLAACGRSRMPSTVHSYILQYSGSTQQPMDSGTDSDGTGGGGGGGTKAAAAAGTAIGAVTSVGADVGGSTESDNMAMSSSWASAMVPIGGGCDSRSPPSGGAAPLTSDLRHRITQGTMRASQSTTGLQQLASGVRSGGIAAAAGVVPSRSRLASVVSVDGRRMEGLMETWAVEAEPGPVTRPDGDFFSGPSRLDASVELQQVQPEATTDAGAADCVVSGDDGTSAGCSSSRRPPRGAMVVQYGAQHQQAVAYTSPTRSLESSRPQPSREQSFPGRTSMPGGLASHLPLLPTSLSSIRPIYHGAGRRPFRVVTTAGPEGEPGEFLNARSVFARTTLPVATGLDASSYNTTAVMDSRELPVTWSSLHAIHRPRNTLFTRPMSLAHVEMAVSPTNGGACSSHCTSSTHHPVHHTMKLYNRDTVATIATSCSEAVPTTRDASAGSGGGGGGSSHVSGLLASTTQGSRFSALPQQLMREVVVYDSEDGRLPNHSLAYEGSPTIQAAMRGGLLGSSFLNTRHHRVGSNGGTGTLVELQPPSSILGKRSSEFFRRLHYNGRRGVSIEGVADLRGGGDGGNNENAQSSGASITAAGGFARASLCFGEDSFGAHVGSLGEDAAGFASSSRLASPAVPTTHVTVRREGSNTRRSTYEPCISYLVSMQRLWHRVESGQPDALLIHRGLRLRVGFHTGLNSPTEVALNGATGRAAYSGAFLAVAREVSNAGPGGCIMMSEVAQRRLAARGAFKPGSPLGCLYMGHYVGSSPNAAAIATLSSFLAHTTATDDGSGGGPTAAACVGPHISTNRMSGTDEFGTSQSPDTTAAAAAVLPVGLCGPPLGVALYQLVGGTAELFTARWALQPGLTRCGPCRLLGSPGAPVRGSNLAVAAVQVLGINALQAWNLDLASGALRLCLLALQRLAAAIDVGGNTSHGIGSGSGNVNANNSSVGGSARSGTGFGSSLYLSFEENDDYMDILGSGRGSSGCSGRRLISGCGGCRKRSGGKGAAHSVTAVNGGGFLSTGRMVVVSEDAWSLATWVADAQAVLVRLPWRGELMQHEFCAETTVSRSILEEMMVVEASARAAAATAVTPGASPSAAAMGISSPLPPAVAPTSSSHSRQLSSVLLSGTRARLGLPGLSSKGKGPAAVAVVAPPVPALPAAPQPPALPPLPHRPFLLSHGMGPISVNAVTSHIDSSLIPGPLISSWLPAVTNLAGDVGGMGMGDGGGRVDGDYAAAVAVAGVTAVRTISTEPFTGMSMDVTISGGSTQPLDLQTSQGATAVSGSTVSHELKQFRNKLLSAPQYALRSVSGGGDGPRPGAGSEVAPSGGEAVISSVQMRSMMFRAPSWESGTDVASGGRVGSRVALVHWSPLLRHGWNEPLLDEHITSKQTTATAPVDIPAQSNNRSGTGRDRCSGEGGSDGSASGVGAGGPSPPVPMLVGSVTACSLVKLPPGTTLPTTATGPVFARRSVVENSDPLQLPKLAAAGLQGADAPLHSPTPSAPEAVGALEAAGAASPLPRPPVPGPFAHSWSPLPVYGGASVSGGGGISGGGAGLFQSVVTGSGVSTPSRSGSSATWRIRTLTEAPSGGQVAACAAAASPTNVTFTAGSPISTPNSLSISPNTGTQLPSSFRLKPGIRNWVRQAAGNIDSPDSGGGGGGIIRVGRRVLELASLLESNNSAAAGAVVGGSRMDQAALVRSSSASAGAVAAAGAAAAVAGSGGLASDLVLLFRGLRLRIGIDVGSLEGTLSKVSGRIVYRGRPVQRATRMATLAKAGQVLCSREGVEATALAATAAANTATVAAASTARGVAFTSNKGSTSGAPASAYHRICVGMVPDLQPATLRVAPPPPSPPPPSQQQHHQSHLRQQLKQSTAETLRTTTVTSAAMRGQFSPPRQQSSTSPVAVGGGGPGPGGAGSPVHLSGVFSRLSLQMATDQVRRMLHSPNGSPPPPPLAVSLGTQQLLYTSHVMGCVVQVHFEQVTTPVKRYDMYLLTLTRVLSEDDQSLHHRHQFQPQQQLPGHHLGRRSQLNIGGLRPSQTLPPLQAPGGEVVSTPAPLQPQRVGGGSDHGVRAGASSAGGGDTGESAAAVTPRAGSACPSPAFPTLYE